MDYRELIVQSGLRMAASGLTVETWGNISARISKNEFIITPSGKAYDRLTPSQRDDATKILQLYEKACRQK